MSTGLDDLLAASSLEGDGEMEAAASEGEAARTRTIAAGETAPPRSDAPSSSGLEVTPREGEPLRNLALWKTNTPT